MPLFECPKCGVVENTATGHYWAAKPDQVACSACYSGKWHGHFPRTQAADGWIEETPQHGSPGKPPFITKPSREDEPNEG